MSPFSLRNLRLSDYLPFGQLGGEWPENEQLISEAMIKDEDRLEAFNEALATVNQVAKFPLHLSHGVNLATSPSCTRDHCTGQSNCHCARSDNVRPR
jgi:hypothetical protein